MDIYIYWLAKPVHLYGYIYILVSQACAFICTCIYTVYIMDDLQLAPAEGCGSLCDRYHLQRYLMFYTEFVNSTLM